MGGAAACQPSSLACTVGGLSTLSGQARLYFIFHGLWILPGRLHGAPIPAAFRMPYEDANSASFLGDFPAFTVTTGSGFAILPHARHGRAVSRSSQIFGLHAPINFIPIATHHGSAFRDEVIAMPHALFFEVLHHFNVY